MIGVAIDVDDTILDTRRRMQRAWSLVLNYDVPIDSVENLSSKEIVERYGSSRHYLWERFWRVLLCLDDSGVELLELDEPLPFAVDVLRGWSRQYVLLYLTGRPQTMRDLTLRELGRFGFPVDKTQLAMLTIQDWLNYFAGTSLNSQSKQGLNSLPRFSSDIRLCVLSMTSLVSLAYTSSSVYLTEWGYSVQRDSQAKIIMFMELQELLKVGKNYEPFLSPANL